MTEKKTCFVISPIGEEKSETRKKSDTLFNHIIKPVMNEFDYEVSRADKIGEPGIITSQVIQRIEKSTLIIADLTGSNANVFYELAVRHAIRKPLIHVITRSEQIPFDVASLRTISYDLTDLDNVVETKKEIKKQVQTIENGSFNMETPISTAIDLLKLKESGDPEQQSLAKVTVLLSIMRREMTHNNMLLERILREKSRAMIGRRDNESTWREVDELPHIRKRRTSDKPRLRGVTDFKKINFDDEDFDDDE